MNESVEERLYAAGIDHQDGVKRLNGSEVLYLRLLGKFVGDENFAGFLACMDAGDGAQAAMHLHALKGLAANLSMTRLYRECVEAETAMRAGKNVKNMEILRESYDAVIGAITSVED